MKRMIPLEWMEPNGPLSRGQLVRGGARDPLEGQCRDRGGLAARDAAAQWGAEASGHATTAGAAAWACIVCAVQATHEASLCAWCSWVPVRSTWADASRPCHESAPVARISVNCATAATTADRRRRTSPRGPRHDHRPGRAGAHLCGAPADFEVARWPVLGGGTGLITRWTLNRFRLPRH